MIKRDLGGGFIAVPYFAVTLNGHHLERLNTMVEPYDGGWAVIAPPPQNKAVDGEGGRRPYFYKTIEDCEKDVVGFIEHGCSVCS